MFKIYNSIFSTSLVCIFLLGFTLGQAQNVDIDSLYNPFPFTVQRASEMRYVCGMGLPRVISRSEADSVIRKAFNDMHIPLSENYYIDNKHGKYHVDAFNPTLNIGYVWISTKNRGPGFIRETKGKPYRNRRHTMRKELVERMQKRYNDYLQNPKKYSQRNIKHIKDDDQRQKIKQLYDNLLQLTGQAHRKAFEDTYFIGAMASDVDRLHLNPIDPIFSEIMTRILASDRSLVEKYLYRSIVFRLGRTKKDEYIAQFIENELKAMLDLPVSSQYLKRLDRILQLVSYKPHEFSSILRNKAYRALIANIGMNNSWKKWHKHYYKLDAFADKVEISMKEARRIDRDNRGSKSFIAPIIVGSERMIVKQISSPTFRQDLADLKNEFDRKNGLTPEIKRRKDKELRAADLAYYEDQNDANRVIMKAKKKAIEKKYKDMELLSQTEQDEYKRRMNVIRNEIFEEMEDQKILEYQAPLKELENDIKRYILWAKAQQGIP